MLLKRLCEYAETLDLPPVMYQRTPVRWLIDLDKEGKFLGLVATSDGGKRDRGKQILTPHVVRSSGPRAKLLCDNAEYVLGVPKQIEDPEKQMKRDEDAVKKHVDFNRVVRACAKATGEPTVEVVLSFLEDEKQVGLVESDEMAEADNLTFRVAGSFPVDLPSVQSFWADFTGAETESGENSIEPQKCIVCGQLCRPLSRHPVLIKRIPGGQASGMALISANSNAFESYGLKASLIAPTCRGCAETYAKAANTLLERESTHVNIGPLAYVFWAKESYNFSFANLISKAEPGEVKVLMTSALTGKQATTRLEASPFYAAALGASGGRVAVRDWLETTVVNAKKNLARYFTLQRIIKRDGSESEPIGLYALSAATVRDPSKDLAPNVPKALLHMALKGGPLPKWLLFQTVKRNRVEQKITRPRAALIKMVLCSQEQTGSEERMEMLDSENRSPAYLCGRLLAVLESIQERAVPGLKATIVDRFFGTASSAPASVFGRLLRGAQPHLGKLRKERKGTYSALSNRLEEVLSGLEGFPKTLALEDQAIFSLGYYHQRAADRAAAIAFMEQKAQEATPDKVTKEEK